MSPSPAADRALGSYRLVRRIAVGGMAEVFEARDPDDQAVVLKVLLPQYAGDPEFITMFRDEARLATGLDHPNLVQVHELGQAGETWFLVMEHVDGPTLAHLLRCADGKAEHLPRVPVALGIGRSLLSALEYLHGRTDADGQHLEVVHRDVTPGNVLIARTGQVKLGDFGIARHRLRQARTRTGVIKGTVQYMSPEQVAGTDDVDQRADLYGVGLILFEMLAGRPFIHANREVDLLKLAQNPPWVPPSILRPELGPTIDQLLRPALARFPEERYPDASSFLKALEETAEQLEPGEGEAPEATLALWVEQTEGLAAFRPGASQELDVDVGPATATRATVPQIPSKRRRPSPWTLIAVVGLLAAAALLWHSQRQRESGPPRVENELVVEGGVVRPPPVEVDATILARAPADAMPLASDAPVMVDTVQGQTPPTARPRPRPRPRPKPRPIHAPRPPDAALTPKAAVETKAELDRLKKRLEQALAKLRSRGILEQDLPASLRARIRALRGQLKRGEHDIVRQTLASLEPDLKSIQVDQRLVEAKLKRVHALLRTRKGRAAKKLRDQQSQALQEFMDSRYASANRQLNRILRTLR